MMISDELIINNILVRNFTALSDTEKESVLTWRNNINIRSWMYNNNTIVKSDHFSFIEKLKNDNHNFYFLIKKGAEELGVVYLNRIEYDTGTADIGIYSKPGIKGAGNTLMEMLIEIAFNKLKLNSLTAEVFCTNEKAVSLYQRFGFKKVNVVKHNTSRKILVMKLNKLGMAAESI